VDAVYTRNVSEVLKAEVELLNPSKMQRRETLDLPAGVRLFEWRKCTVGPDGHGAAAKVSFLVPALMHPSHSANYSTAYACIAQRVHREADTPYSCNSLTACWNSKT
jgi:hypothetical protein